MTERTDQPDSKEAVEAQLCAYLEGDLTPSEQAELERHLSQNATHRQLLSDLAEARRWLRALPREIAPPEVAEVYRSQVERSMLMGEDAPPIRRAARWPRYAMLAAVVTLTVGLGTVVVVVLSGPGRGPAGPVSMGGLPAAPTLPAARPARDAPAGAALPSTPAPELSTNVAAHNGNVADNAVAAPAAAAKARGSIAVAAQSQFGTSTDAQAASSQTVAVEPRTVHLMVATADPVAVDRFIRRQLSAGRDADEADRLRPVAGGGGGGRRGFDRETAATPSTPAAAAAFVPTTAPAVATVRRYLAIGVTADQAIQLTVGLKGAAGAGGDVIVPSPSDRKRLIDGGQTIAVVVSRPSAATTFDVVRVSTLGTIVLPGVEPIPAAGVTADELAQRVAAAYAARIPSTTDGVGQSDAVPPATAGPATTQPSGGLTTVVIEVTPLPALR